MSTTSMVPGRFPASTVTTPEPGWNLSWARNHMRNLREVGASWQQIGETIGWHDDAAAMAFAAASGAPWLDPATGQWREATFSWRCRACSRRIVDRSPGLGADCGHTEDCSRRAAA
ncbi:MAG TPA: hypothetical protein VGS19_07635 [Streptosporangiaceae bacterium]|nr:hypothetical protein [Streptosporangiaceae bacterium]